MYLNDNTSPMLLLSSNNGPFIKFYEYISLIHYNILFALRRHNTEYLYNMSLYSYTTIIARYMVHRDCQ